MGVVFLILILLGAALALVSAIVAIQAWLSFRRARLAFQNDVTEEVTRLATRTGELEKGLSALDARAGQLPVQISRLQQSLATLKILTRALASTLRESQRVLSATQLKSSGTATLADQASKLWRSWSPGG